jgi:RimJ/RimL family protein N-acetyltransferase
VPENGYATEAAIACRQYAFEVLGYEEVFSLVRDDNIASMNVAIRNGMTIRGRFTRQYRGVDVPHLIFSVKKTK